ncbi:MAG: helix-turn-helix domain-containing protein [Cellvibrionaceae bacterium]|nr:helix-turn-helix domain-containing protein [Cellvibrionaceae bacterium]
MKINRQVLKSARKQKLWSQEQLAAAAGLSLRTVQRIETSGSGSMESVAALAAALELPAEQLQQHTPVFSPYRHTQLGYVIWVFFFVPLTLLVPYLHTLSSWAMALVLLSLLLPPILFFSLTVQVSETEISWYFGPRFWRKQLPLSEVLGAKVVKNPWLAGWGIRMLGNGFLYNVSGIMAVELQLKSGAVVRLGSDEPNYLQQAISAAIAQSDSEVP